MSQLNVLHLTPVYDWIANSNVLIKKTMKKIKEIYKYLLKKIQKGYIQNKEISSCIDIARY